MPAELSDFTPDFILKVLALMYQRPDFLRFVAPAMKPEYFSDKVDITLAGIFLDFYKRYPKSILTRTVIYEELRELVDKKRLEKKEYPDYMDRFSKILEPVPDAEYIEAKTGEFLAKRSMELAYDESLALLKKGKLDEVVEIMTRARSLVKDKADLTEDFILNDEIEAYAKKLEAPEETEIWKGVKTGIEKLDECLFWGGIDAEEMFIDCGPPGRGKSISLLNKAIWANLQGHDILYYTLEVGKKIYEMRYHACITGIPMLDLRREALLFRRRWEILKREIPDMGKFILRDLPARSLKPSAILRDIRHYRETGRDIKGLVVDYADIMSADKKYSSEDKRLELGNIYEDLRGIAKEEKVYVYSASQGNRSSLNKKEIDIDSLAEDFSKSFTADYVAGLCQTKAEALERTSAGSGTGTIRYFLAKNRNESKGVNVSVMTDFTRARMSMYDWAKFDELMYGTTV